MLAKVNRAAVAALFPVLCLVACAHAAAPVRPSVTMALCGGDPQAMPTVVQVICNTDDLTARNLVWTSWGKQVATAKGTAVVDMCAYEDCHTGSFSSVRITLIASKIAKCARNVRAYSTLRYEFVHGSPWQGIPANMKTSGYISAPNRPLPPPNQTVAMTCP